ncbi:hypothetical protein AB9P05_24070 [Roseivirga sp. BDSF3-8]|uniref:hypothetical protein n=1 Tax=Roseivirga sp. BDSF3-8 TaxID=3241598 RepID=UPI0035323D77
MKRFLLACVLFSCSSSVGAQDSNLAREAAADACYCLELLSVEDPDASHDISACVYLEIKRRKAEFKAAYDLDFGVYEEANQAAYMVRQEMVSTCDIVGVSMKAAQLEADDNLSAKEKLTTRVTSAICECAGSKAGDTSSEEQKLDAVTSCSDRIIKVKKDELLEAYGIKEETTYEWDKVTASLIMAIIRRCPDFGSLVFRRSLDDTNRRTMRGESPSPYALEGTLSGVQGEQFRSFMVKDTDGKTHEFLWLQYFSGSRELMKTSPEKLKGKKVRVEYIQTDLLNPASGEFEPTNVIRKFTLL